MNADTEEEKKRKKENGIADRCDSLYFEDISRFETFLLYVTGIFFKIQHLIIIRTKSIQIRFDRYIENYMKTNA